MAWLRQYQEEQLVAQYRQEARVLDYSDFARREKQAEALGVKLTHELENLPPPGQNKTGTASRKQVRTKLHTPTEYELKQIRCLGSNQLCEDARRHLGEIVGRDALTRESVAERNNR